MTKQKVIEECNEIVLETESSGIDIAHTEVDGCESGQTSDQSASCGEVLSLPDEYVWQENVCRVDEFFTYNDFLYLIQESERQYNEFLVQYRKFGLFCSCYGKLFRKIYKKHIVSIWLKYRDLYADEIYPELHFSIMCDFFGNSEYLEKFETITELKNASFEQFRDAVYEGCKLYDFSDLSKVPNGVSDIFLMTCERIDQKKAEIEDNFVAIALYLSDLSSMSAFNFMSYGCRNIYDFSENRFGFGRTTTKNFIAIYNKFMGQTSVKEAYRDYSYSQLTELVPVDEKLMSEFNPKMTIKEIRSKKKELIGGNVSFGNGDRSVKLSHESVVGNVSIVDLKNVLEKFINPYFKENKSTQSASFYAYDRAIQDFKNALNLEFKVEF